MVGVPKLCAWCGDRMLVLCTWWGEDWAAHGREGRSKLGCLPGMGGSWTAQRTCKAEKWRESSCLHYVCDMEWEGHTRLPA